MCIRDRDDLVLALQGGWIGIGDGDRHPKVMRRATVDLRIDTERGMVADLKDGVLAFRYFRIQTGINLQQLDQILLRATAPIQRDDVGQELPCLLYTSRCV